MGRPARGGTHQGEKEDIMYDDDDPWEEGFEAYLTGERNLYEIDTLQYKEWRAGNLAAFAEARQRNK